MLVRLRRSLGGLPPGLGQPVSNREARGRRAANRRPAAPGGAAPGGAAPGGAAPGGAAPGGAAPGGAAPGGAGLGAGRQASPSRRRAAPAPAGAPGSAAPAPGAEIRRERGRGRVVAVTGAARGLGHALTVRLAASARVGRVVAIDGHRGDATGVTWRVVDVRDPALAGRLAGVDVVVHTDLDVAPDSDRRSLRAVNLRGPPTRLAAAGAGRVGRVVLVTSAMVCGAQPDNPVPLAESAPLGADSGGSVVGDLLEVEQLAQRSPQTNPGMAVTVVRPAALVGEGVDTLITRHFEAPRPLAVKGCAPRWQFFPVDDR